MVLWENEAQAVDQIGEKLRLDSGTLTPLLKRMESKKLITRRRKTDDERSVEIALTNAGKALKKEASKIPAKMVSRQQPGIITIFGIMKALVVLLSLFVFSNHINGQTVSTQTHVDFGYVDSTWTYKSAGLGVKFPLPKGWYFMNGATRPPSYVKVGSRLIHIMGYNKPMRVPIADFNRIHNNSIAILFAFSQLPDSGIVIRKPLDYNADKTFSFGITTATDTSTYDFLRYTCLRCTDESFKEIYTGEVKIGNTAFDGYITGVTDQKGNKMGHFIGIKRISNHYLVLQFNFPDPETFERYKDYLKDLQVK